MLSNHLELSLILSIITNCTYAITNKSNITAYLNKSFTFFKLPYYV